MSPPHSSCGGRVQQKNFVHDRSDRIWEEVAEEEVVHMNKKIVTNAHLDENDNRGGCATIKHGSLVSLALLPWNCVRRTSSLNFVETSYLIFACQEDKNVLKMAFS